MNKVPLVKRLVNPEAKVSAGSIIKPFMQLYNFMRQGHLMVSLIV
jgi:hypothetical protein